MTTIALNTPFIEGGTHAVSVWNGRVLTAEDLKAEQGANAERRRLLGQAIGSGVVSGFEVTLGNDATTVDVTAGLAVSKDGAVIELATDVIVSLLDSSTVNSNGGSRFGECDEQPSFQFAGDGLYVLLVGTATGTKETAPKVPFGGNGSASECGPKYTVDGVSFGLLKLKEAVLVEGSDYDEDSIRNLNGRELEDATRLRNASRLRNIAATLLNGIDALERFWTEPKTENTGYGPLDALRKARGNPISECDVPLALLLWNDSTATWADMWSVRRRPTAPAAGPVWAVPIADRRMAEGEATFLQFLDHIAWIASLLSTGTPTVQLDEVEALKWFDYLPPAGVVPMLGLHTTEPSNATGLDFTTFFKDLPVRPYSDEFGTDPPLIISRSRAEHLLRSSFAYAPTRITTEPSGITTGRMHWVYAVEENRAAAVVPGEGPAHQPYALFTSGHMPPVANGRFDVTRWNLGNFAFVDVPAANGG